MSSLKVTKYSQELHQLRASWGILQAGRLLLLESVQKPVQYGDFYAYENALSELNQLDAKLDLLYDEIKTAELMHEAALLTGNYQELVVRRKF